MSSSSAATKRATRKSKKISILEVEPIAATATAPPAAESPIKKDPIDVIKTATGIPTINQITRISEIAPVITGRKTRRRVMFSEKVSQPPPDEKEPEPRASPEQEAAAAAVTPTPKEEEVAAPEPTPSPVQTPEIEPEKKAPESAPIETVSSMSPETIIQEQPLLSETPPPPPPPKKIPRQSLTPGRETAVRPPQKHSAAAEEAPASDDTKLTDLEREKKEYDQELASPIAAPDDFLYPHMNDPLFTKKITSKKEFADFVYDGELRDIKSYSEVLCRAPFELAPHQNLVKNFLSFQTPYNSLLLYHGLGTGKTCSAIGITEEIRTYMKQTGITQKIIIVASPNVQGNFRKELFNDARLEENNGIWSLNTCIGNKLLKEINPTNIQNIPREKIVSQINTLINQYYEFMGYIEFSKFIQKRLELKGEFSEKEKKKYEIQQLRRYFNNRFIVIDEVHNITSEKDIIERTATSSKASSLSVHLLKLARYCDNLRFLLLSATPMYNKYTEIIWLTNLMNLNDKRPVIKLSDVFTRDGGFTAPKDGRRETGDELLLRKLIGYVSYVRGENPYTFPFRLYPRDFGVGDKTYNSVGGDPAPAANAKPYPKYQINGRAIDEPLKHIQVYTTPIGEEQERGYMKILRAIRGGGGSAADQKDATFKEEEMIEKENYGYSKLIAPLEALNMVYPVDAEEAAADEFEEAYEEMTGAPIIAPIITGKRGLRKINKFEGMKITEGNYIFDYKPAVLEKYGRIFSQNHIHKYSHKIADICDNIRRGAEGIILIYSFHIDGGLVPMALALEEMGFSRFSSVPNTKSLFEKPPTEPIDATTMRTRSEIAASEGGGPFSPAKYVMITGDKRFSQNNMEDLKHIVSPDNRTGEKIKVVLISLSGSEGLDFKCVRQIHILDSWYNMSRIEQIIGRGVRNLSHCSLPFEKRNVEIYLHTTQLTAAPEEEAVDLYLYRFAENKAVKIGKVSRLLKQAAADCMLNIAQTNFTVERLNEIAANQKLQIRTSSGRDIIFRAGDKPYTSICDYMENCNYECRPTPASEPRSLIPDTRTYDEVFMDRNRDLIMKRIRQLYRENSSYRRADLVAQINAVKKYPIDQIFSALSAFINNENEYIIDRNGRYGTLINHNDVYLFQPNEYTDQGATIYERSAPIDAKRDRIRLQVPAGIAAAAAAAPAEEESAAAAPGEPTAAPAPPPPQGFMDKFRQNMEIFDKKNPQGKTWYFYAKQAQNMVSAHGVPSENVRQYVIEHMVDVYPNKLELLRWAAAAAGEPPTDPLELSIYNYIQTRRIHAPETDDSPEMHGYLMDDGEQWVVYILEDGEFNVATEEQKKIFIPELRRFTYHINTYNNIIGFISPMSQKGQIDILDYAFKMKNMSQTRGNKGMFCEKSSGKSETIKYINTVLGNPIYSDENTKGIVKPIFCCGLEFLLRYYHETKRDGKNWFFSPERAAINKVKDR